MTDPDRDSPPLALDKPRDIGLGLLAILLGALLAALPLLLHGPSCGHDFGFHLENWMEVASQWHAGILWPRWAFHAAWNAGEPRFLFYPPLSWLAGAAIGAALPLSAVPAAYTVLALALSGWTMQRLVRRWRPLPIATFCGCLYLANPYMLFVSYERCAYAELLAAAWMPMLLGALLSARVDPLRLAVPVALLWITNAPAAVIGCYTILLIGLIRLAMDAASGRSPRALFSLSLRVASGTALGLAVAAFYVLPAAYERRFVQISMAVIAGMRPADNFLFAHTADPLHDQVLRTASWNAVGFFLWMGACTTVYLVRSHGSHGNTTADTTITETFHERRSLVVLLGALSLLLFLLLLPASKPIWQHAPELSFLQFPWRFLTVLSTIAVLLAGFALPRMHLRLALPLGLLLACGLGIFADRVYRQPCDEEDTVAAQENAFRQNRGSEPTDEYTPASADNDALARGTPLTWLTTTPDGPPALHPAAASPEAAQLRRGRLSIQVVSQPVAAFLIVRRRSFPGWQVRDNGMLATDLPDRNDGLLAIPLTPGTAHRIAIEYTWTGDQQAGFALSLAALFLCGGLLLHRRRSAVASYPQTSRIIRHCS